MHSEELVSVVIPTIGRESLRAAVASVLKQSHAKLEVVVVNDSIQPLAAEWSDPRVRVLSTAGGEGGNVARALGIKNSLGSTIALLDDDDIWTEYKLSKQLSRRPKHDLWVATCYCYLWSGEKDLEKLSVWPRQSLRAEETISDYLIRRRYIRPGGGFIPSSTLLAPRDLFETVRLREDLALHQDLDWLVRVGQVPGIQIIQVREPLVAYRTDSQQSVTKSSKWRKSAAWVEQSRELLSAGALADFYLTVPFSMAIRAADWRPLLGLARASFSAGVPSRHACIYALALVARSFANGIVAAAGRLGRRRAGC